MTVAILVAACCVLIEGFFSGAEIAIMAADRLSLKERAAAGQRGAQLALKLREHPQALLSTTLLGTNLAVITATAFVTLAVVKLYGPSWEWVTMLVLSPVILVLGEIIPKSVYQQRAVAMACRVSRPLWTIRRLAHPLIWSLEMLSSTLLRALRVDPSEHQVLVTREDLVVLVEGSAQQAGSDIEPEEEELIERIFELPETDVREVMIPLVEVVALEESSTIAEAIGAVQEHGYSRYPIYRERIDDIRGVLHVFDLLHEQRLERPVGDLVREALIVPEAARVDALLHRLRTAGQNMAVVVDEYGGVEGIVTLEDIIEELVGEIDDEHDKRSEFVRQVGERSFLVLARAEVDQLNEELGLALPEGDYETLGGFLLERLRRFPAKGESHWYNHIRFTATRVTDRSILEILVELPATTIPPTSARSQ